MHFFSIGHTLEDTDQAFSHMSGLSMHRSRCFVIFHSGLTQIFRRESQPIGAKSVPNWSRFREKDGLLRLARLFLHWPQVFFTAARTDELRLLESKKGWMNDRSRRLARYKFPDYVLPKKRTALSLGYQNLWKVPVSVESCTLKCFKHWSAICNQQKRRYSGASPRYIFHYTKTTSGWDIYKGQELRNITQWRLCL